MKLNVTIKFCKEYFDFEVDIDEEEYQSLTHEEKSQYLNDKAFCLLTNNAEFFYDLVDE